MGKSTPSMPLHVIRELIRLALFQGQSLTPESDEYVRLVDAGRHELDPGKRMALYH